MSKKSKQQSVLIFEDDIDLASQWIKTLKKKGMLVHHAMTVDEALVYCNQMEFDVIILDIFVAGPSGKFVPRGGLTLLSYIRTSSLEQIPKWGVSVPILVVSGATARLGFDPLANAMAVGGSRATDVLRKPFTTEALYLKVLNLIKEQDKK